MRRALLALLLVCLATTPGLGSWAMNGTTSLATGPAALTLGSTITVFVWANPTDLGEAGFGTIYNHGPAATFRSRLLCFTANTWLFSAGASVDGNWSTPMSGLGAWQSIAATYDFGSVANVPVMYLNGVSGAVTTVSSPTVAFDADGGTLYVGNNSLTTNTFNGTLGHFTMWKRILTAAEILDVHRRGPFARPKTLFVYYPGEGTAISTADYSGSANIVSSFSNVTINAGEPVIGSLLIR